MSLRFKIITAVRMSMLVFWVATRCGRKVVTNILEEGIASIFRVKWNSSETLVTTIKTTLRHNPEDHNRQICPCA
jgi:hypothetical protein